MTPPDPPLSKETLTTCACAPYGPFCGSQRDAQIERVRALHPHVTGPVWDWQTIDGVFQRVQTGEAEFCTACSWAEPTGRFAHAELWPCPTIVTLEDPHA
jgi:hypothetical protein